MAGNGYRVDYSFTDKPDFEGIELHAFVKRERSNNLSGETADYVGGMIRLGAIIMNNTIFYHNFDGLLLLPSNFQPH